MVDFISVASVFWSSPAAGDSCAAPWVASDSTCVCSRDDLSSGVTFSDGGDGGALWSTEGFSLELSVGSDMTLDGDEDPKILGSEEDMAEWEARGGCGWGEEPHERGARA